MTGQISWITDSVVRPVLAVLMLALGSVQIRLALHNNTLRGALRASRDFLRRDGLLYLVYLASAGGLILVLQLLTLLGAEALNDALLRQLWVAIAQIVSAATGGWLLATWVCFYKSRETGSREVTY